jgi:biopolymer transport protein ExbD
VKFRSRTKSHLDLPRLPLVALVDVVLFLLLYFLIAGTMGGEETHLGATLASDRRGGGASGVGLSSQVIRIEAEGGGVVYRLGGRTITDRKELGVLLAQLPKEPGVVIRAGDTVPVEAAAAALQVAQDAGFTRVSYVGTR